ncbi:hypothetical protein LA03_31755 [Burkholderia gladioli]|nr:hypothetical protein LA03_31755 [Burkholderia gladioli]
MEFHMSRTRHTSRLAAYGAIVCVETEGVTGNLVADCSMLPNGSQKAQQLAAAGDLAAALRLVAATVVLPTGIRAIADAALAKAGWSESTKLSTTRSS